MNSVSFVAKTRESESKKEEIGNRFGGIHAAKIIPDLDEPDDLCCSRRFVTRGEPWA